MKVVIARQYRSLPPTATRSSKRGKKRHRYGVDFNAMVLAQCDESEASVTSAAASHGSNDKVMNPRCAELTALSCQAEFQYPSLTAQLDTTGPASLVGLDS